MTRRSLLAIFIALPLFAQAAPSSEQDDIRRAVSLLDYIARDYPNAVDASGKIVSDAEYAEMKDFINLIQGYIAGNESLPTLARAIDAKGKPDDVAKIAQGIRETLIQIYGIQTVAAELPDLAKGKRIYEQSCATCHGLRGDADTPVAKALDPTPSAFSDPELLGQMSPFQAFNTITYGVNGTAMAGFASFAESDRWALASYIFTLRKGAPAHDPTVAAKVGWKDTLSASDAVLLEKLRATGTAESDLPFALAQARHFSGEALPKETAAASLKHLATARRLMAESFTARDAGDAARARDLSVAAYLDGFEKMESVLVSQGRQSLVSKVESAFLNYRRSLDGRGVPSGTAVAVQGEMTRALDEVEAWMVHGGAAGKSSTFVGAFLILFREGLEALLLIALVLACLGKVGALGMKRWVHGSWIAAIALGAATWFVAERALSGADRELMEGWISLLACGVLVYVSFWILSKRDSTMWMNYLMEKLRRKSSVGALTVITVSFFAVYREVFETVLFLQALKLHAPGDGAWLLGGCAAAVAVLLLVAQAVFYFGKRLPLQAFFSTTGYLLCLLAVVFLGQGIHSLGEAGLVDLKPVRFWTIPNLGIFPFRGTLLPQLALVAVYLSAFLVFKFRPHWLSAPAETPRKPSEVA